MSSDAGATLSLWEALAAAPPAARGAVVLASRGDADSYEAASRAPIARAATAAIAELREREGPVVDTVVTCPECGVLLDLPVSLDDLPPAAETGPVIVGGAVVRAPSTEDLLVALASADVAATLQERCVERPAGAVEPLSDDVLRVAEDLCGAAALVARIECPGCGAVLAADIDVVDLLCARVADDAGEVLRDVAEIARAFGWSEAEIVALSPARRHHYLALARGIGGRR